MQLKKIAIVFLVVVMMFSLAAVFTAAEESNTGFSLSAKLESEGALSADPFGVKPGAIIELVISIDANPGMLSDLDVRVEFDTEALKFLGIATEDYGDVFNKNHSLARVDAKKDGLLQVWVQAASGHESDATGEFITLRFKVADDYDGNVKKLGVYEAFYRVRGGAITPSTVPSLPAIKAHNYGAPEYIDGKCVNDSINRYTCTDAGCGDVLDVVVKPKGHTVGELIAAVAPTTEKTGLRAHYQCTACSKTLDTDMWTEINPVVTKLPKMIKTPENSVWTKGNAAPEYVSDGSFDGFKSVKVDGKVVPEGAFVAKADENGNTVITLEPVYLKTLAAGDHKVSIVFEDESWDKDYACDADFSVRSNGAIVTIIIIVVAILVLAAGVIAALKVLKKKNII